MVKKIFNLSEVKFGTNRQIFDQKKFFDQIFGQITFFDEI